ncbi:MAG: heavy-metal-associated domain-containing protein [Rhodoblastus sp.]|nr:MAG: heavy-metal-associated domain-containing protein [Rhodoblastus sp.]
MSDVAFIVEDMSCGHCVGAIAKAVEAAMPGAKVTADLAAKRVAVTGAADAKQVEKIISDAGYTPKRA